MEEIANFQAFWELYPKLSGRKPGKYSCGLWFEAKKPDDETVTEMLSWIKLHKFNSEIFEAKKEFYALLPHPIRFLKERFWEDPLDAIAKPKEKFNQDCVVCGEKGVATYKGKWYCRKHHRETTGEASFVPVSAERKVELMQKLKSEVKK